MKKPLRFLEAKPGVSLSLLGGINVPHRDLALNGMGGDATYLVRGLKGADFYEVDCVAQAMQDLQVLVIS